VSFVLFVLLNTILNVDFYKGSISEKFYETTIDVASTSIYKQKDQMKIDFTENELREILMQTVSEEDFESTLVSFIRQIVEPDFGENGIATVVLDLSKISGKLPGFAEILAEKLFATLPDCKRGEMPTDENLCIPEGLSVEDFKAQAISAFDAGFLSSIPSQVKVLEIQEQDLVIYGDKRLDKNLLWNVWWMTVSINLLLLFIISLIILKPWYKVLKWISKPLISGSIFSGLIFLAIYNLPKLLVRAIESGATKDSVLVKDEVDSILRFVGDLFTVISTGALWLAGSLLLVGISIYIAGVLGKHHSNG